MWLIQYFSVKLFKIQFTSRAMFFGDSQGVHLLEHVR